MMQADVHTSGKACCCLSITARGEVFPNGCQTSFVSFSSSLNITILLLDNNNNKV